MTKQSWRDILPIHPAAELFPPLSRAELKELAADIRANGIWIPILLWFDETQQQQCYLIDGRNRLDALELHGRQIVKDGDILWTKLGIPVQSVGGLDPWQVAISANIKRRHLTAEQKRDLIAKVLKARPEQSDQQIAEQVKADHKTVGKVRKEMESTGDVPQLEKTVGKDGKARKQPAKRKPAVQEVFDSPQEAHEPVVQNWELLVCVLHDLAIQFQKTSTAIRKALADKEMPEDVKEKLFAAIKNTTWALGRIAQ